MSNINLLPWRQQLQAKQKRHFMLQLGVACLLSLALLMLAYSHVKQAAQAQQQHNIRLQTASTQLDSTLGTIEQLRQQQHALHTKIQVIDKLQQQRHLPVQLFNQLPNWISDDVHLDDVHLSDKGVVISGQAQTHSSLALMIEQIEGSHWLNQPRLSVSATDDATAGSGLPFILQLNIRNLSKAGDE
ncbi:MAG: PilN domain-containing protein [Oceanisphaera sp.]|uniref:PilN domain-containing protein n=1 Tax=Oceanisphaera sp. TaxID=1929979 RepID=UPI003F947B5A